MRWTRFIAMGLAALPIPSSRAVAQTTATKPVVWMGPPGAQDGRCFRELFEHPDEWKETRGLVDGILYAGQNINKQFKDEDLQKWFGMMRQWELKLQLEVGAVKE